MAIEMSYSSVRANLAKVLDQVTDDTEVIFVTRRGKRKAAIIDADELSSLLETAHLLASPKNAERLLRAYNRAMDRAGKPRSIEDVKREVGLSEAA